MKNNWMLMISFVLLLLFLNYNLIDRFLINVFDDYESGIVERIVDGDTVVVNQEKIRLLGINSPEKGEVGYNEAKEFLENQILNKEVLIYFDGEKFDRYGRKLGYIFLDEININLESVRLGYSGYYFPNGHSRFYSNFVSAWDECLKKNIGICEFRDEKCIIIDYVDVDLQIISIKNICSHKICINGWTVKDEGRKKFIFEEECINPNDNIILTKDDFRKDYVWTKSGDSAFLRDHSNKLVDFYHY